jgi:DNA polymerase
MNEFFQYGVKAEGTLISSGKHRSEFTPAEWLEFKKYCQNDVDQLRHHAQLMMPKMTPGSLRFIALSERMYNRPRLELNLPRLEIYEQELIARQEADMAELQHLFQFQDRGAFLKAIRSRTEFPKMLEALGAETPMKASPARVKTVTEQIATLREINAANYTPATVSPELRREIRKLCNSVNKGVMTPALAKTDLEFQALMDSEDPYVSLLCRVRAENNSSIALSRCRTFIKLARLGGPFPVELSAYPALTGRYTAANAAEGGMSSKSQVQNLSKRSGDKVLRSCIIAPAGYRLVAADSSQIEARVLAWAAGQHDLVEAFAQHRDVYSEFATQAYGYPVDRSKERERFVGKTCILQLGYQSGPKKLATKLRQEKVDVSTETNSHDEECDRIVDVYRTVNYQIRIFWSICREVIRAMTAGEQGVFGGPEGTLFHYNGQDSIFGHSCASVALPDGYKLWYPRLRYDQEAQEYQYDRYDRRSKKWIVTKLYGGKLAENLIQALAFAIIRWQMIRIDLRCPVVLNVHDEIVSLVPAAEAETALEYMINTMKTSPPWLPAGLPLDAEGGYGDNYAEV